MNHLVDFKAAVVIPNWNGLDTLADCLKSLTEQSLKHLIIVVDNGSTDHSAALVVEKYPKAVLIKNIKNEGFAGGVNAGFKYALENDIPYVASLNNDAVADPKWLEELVTFLDKDMASGIATSKILDASGKTINSTGDFYTNWGLPYPRGRDEATTDKYDELNNVFAASGGASLYRTSMLKNIGLFDEDFFAYYEDVDLSFRAQLAGWHVSYVPSAIVYHQIGATSQKIKGFTTYQAAKNLPWLAIKNVPGKYLVGVLIRLKIALFFFWLRAITRHQGWSATKGLLVSYVKIPKKLLERKRIQQSKKVSDKYIWGIIVKDLPVNASALRSLRSKWWKLIRRANVNSH